MSAATERSSSPRWLLGMTAVLVVLALLQSCVDAFNSHPLMANRRPRDPEEASRGHHEVGDHVVASLSDDERIGLLRCQLCHDVKDALQANAKTREASAAAASRMADDACSILDGALERGGVVFNQRGAAYAQAAAGIAKAACPLLVSELRDPLVTFAGTVAREIDGHGVERNRWYLPQFWGV